VSVHLEALADEVFDAAAAQSFMSGQSSRRSYGVVIRNPDYPDLFFMNGIDRLVAPRWGASELEAALREPLPGIQNLRATSRDPQTIAMLGPRLAAAGYDSEIRVAMVQVREAHTRRSTKISIAAVETSDRWKDFETSIRADSAEHEWSDAMTLQMIALHRWRAAHSAHHFFLAYDGDRPVAHVGLYQHGSNAYFHALYTLPSARRSGIGSALTVAMAEQARAMGSERLVLQCIKDTALPAFYERLGFRTVGEQCIWTRPR
jgi:GNAT superfamily N-acetyltransferase